MTWSERLITFGPAAALLIVVVTGYAVNWRRLAEVARRLKQEKD